MSKKSVISDVPNAVFRPNGGTSDYNRRLIVCAAVLLCVISPDVHGSEERLRAAEHRTTTTAANTDSADVQGANPPSGARVAKAPPIIIKVGIIAGSTEDPGIHLEEDRFQQLEEFSKSEANPDKHSVHFLLATGGYNDVYFWAAQSKIDLGLFTPAVYGLMQQNSLHWRILALEAAKNDAEKFSYFSDCVVPYQNGPTNWDDVLIVIKNGQAKFVFVDPLSSSGYIAPLYAISESIGLGALEDASVPFTFRFTHDNPGEYIKRELSNGHTNYVPMLFIRHPEAIGSKENNARATPRASSSEDDSVRVITNNSPLPHLLLPHGVVAVQERFEREKGDVLGAIFRAAENSAAFTNKWFNTDISLLKDQSGSNKIHDFGDLTNWMNQLGIASSHPEAQELSLEDISNLLVAYSEQEQPHLNKQQRPPLRIALVLSGGGAKCAYQVGAIQAIEAMLAQLRAAFPNRADQFDIALVVGTSGGAINAIPVAMGITRPKSIASSRDPMQEPLPQIWLGVDKWSILKPNLSFRIALASFCGEIMVILTIGAAFVVKRVIIHYYPNSSLLKNFETARPMFTYLDVVVGFVFLLIALTKWGGDLLDVLWLDAPFWFFSAMFVFLIGEVFHDGGVKFHLRLRNAREFFSLRRLFCVLVIPLTGSALVVFLFRADFKSIIGSDGLERELVKAYTWIVPPPAGAKLSMHERIGQISHTICAPGGLRRDLVITASNIRTIRDMPSDLYFYAQHDAPKEPPSDSHNWIQMPPDQLLDVVLGSGAIFPLCPARTGIGHDSRSEDFQLIDGGFAHNSPLEAATEWKATHIFLIEASPTETNNVGGFFHNSRVAFNYLYGQAQSVDLRVKSTTKATLFTLRPTRLKAGLLDFDHYSISNAIEQGRDDANRKNFLDRSNRPPFLREPAQPNFQ